MEFAQQLVREKKDLFIKVNGGIALPAAGTIYWLGLAVAGFYLSPRNRFLISAFTSGMIFPLGLLLSKPMKSDIMTKSAFTGLLLPAFASMLMFWPLAIAGSSNDISFFPLALTIGMGIHWPVIGWMYDGKVFIWHGIVRAVGCTILWYTFPEGRFTIIPFFVAMVYLITIFGIKREVNQAIMERSSTVV
jgi:hypothetical protein